MQPNQTTRVSKYCIPGVTLTNKGDHWQIRKIGLSAKRVKSDPAFNNTRKRAKQFAHAIEWAKRINAAILPGTGIKQNTGRLAGILNGLLPLAYPQGDSVLKALQQQPEALLGFDFNEEAKWDQVTTIPLRCEYITQKGQWIFHLPVHKPPNSIEPPPGVTHYRIKANAITIHKDGRIIASHTKQTSLFPFRQVTVPQTCLEVDALVNEGAVSIAFLYIQWYSSAGNGTVVKQADIPGVLTITKMYSGIDI